MDPGVTLGLLAATFTASFVEFVEALTIVLAMGTTRGWRSTMAGVVAAVAALAAFTGVAGYALTTWLPEALLQLAVGTLLLVFGLQWLRKAILRSSGLLATHDEEAAFASQTAAAAAAASGTRLGLDWFSFVVSFKGVFLEGVEVVFIVITFGLNAGSVPVASLGAAAAGVVVVALGAAAHRPLARVPENTLKYGEVRRRPAAGELRHLLVDRGARDRARRRPEPAVARRRARHPRPAGGLVAAQPRAGARAAVAAQRARGGAPGPRGGVVVILLRGFARFWYDFVIGDDWKIAAAVGTVLLAGAAVVAAAVLPERAATALIAAALLAAFTAALAIDVRRR